MVSDTPLDAVVSCYRGAHAWLGVLAILEEEFRMVTPEQIRR